jgi:hypothetical protein
MVAENLPRTEGVEYRIVEGYPDYAVGDDGSVWSKRRKNYWNKMNPTPDQAGYLRVPIRNGRRITRHVHKLVLEAFVGQRPVGQHGCHSPDPTVTNNRLSNLRWDTVLENARDRARHGTQCRGESYANSKLTEESVLAIRNEYFSGDVKAESIAKKFGVTATLIQNIVRGKAWQHVGDPISSDVLTRHGERNNFAKITAKDVVEMRSEFARGETTVRQLASKYGLTYEGAYDALRGTNWKHAGGPLMEKLRCQRV